MTWKKITKNVQSLETTSASLAARTPVPSSFFSMSTRPKMPPLLLVYQAQSPTRRSRLMPKTSSLLATRMDSSAIRTPVSRVLTLTVRMQAMKESGMSRMLAS